MTATGKVYLIPAWLSEASAPEAVLPAPVLARVRGLRDFVVEDAKSARRFLAACGHPVPMRDLNLRDLNEHTALRDVPALLQPAREGRDLGVLSEAGAPAVADPGARLVAAAHAEAIAVVPLVGPSSILLALMACGLEGQRFRFLGYLPAEGAERAARIAQIEAESAERDESQVFIETPYRNDAMLAELLKSCRASTRLAVAADLTGPGESIRSAPIGDWRASPGTLGKQPAIFVLLAKR